MHILAIDIGTYSVKYISSFVDRRKINHTDMSEVIVRDFLEDHPDMPLLEAQVYITQEIIENVARAETKIIFQAPPEFMTTRFLTLPVKSKKKAELMLPFQLEEDIPYSLSEIHYAYRLEGQKTQHFALVELAKLNIFNDYFNLSKEKNCLPNILTTEASVVENYFNLNPMAGPFCVLDIGHTTSKAYFFYNSRLIATHTSYLGGKHINEMISHNYNIELDEATIYKHQNAFLLTSNQYSDVDGAQSDFARSMDKVFLTLVNDFARWKIGFKVNFGLSLNHVFVCGGTSNIKNIANYLTEKFDTKVSLFESFDNVEGEKIDLNPKNKSKFAIANMMSHGFRKKNRFINLLIGKFAQAGTSEIPLHSFTFIGARVLTASVVIAISFFVERIFIQKDINFVNNKLNNLMKNEELAINGRLRRSLAQNPKPLHDALVKKQRTIKQEISSLQSAIETESLSPLVTISQIAANSEATLIDFSANDVGEVNATFSSESLDDLKKLKGNIENSSFFDVVAELNESKLQLKVKALGK